MRGSAPRPQRLPTEDLYDVDDGPLLRKRKLVKGICITQILICLGLTAISIRRARILLVLVPFFLSAGVLGYLGADNCRPAYIAAHFMGSGGLSLVFFLYILGESFLKRSGSDLYFFAISFPNDLFMLCTAGFSISLYFDLQRYQKQLAAKREQMREQFEHIASSAVSSECAAAVERRLESNPTLKNDLRCPISLEVMRDPVIAGAQTLSFVTHAQSKPRTPFARLSHVDCRRAPLLTPLSRAPARAPERRRRPLVRERCGRTMADGPPHVASDRARDAESRAHS